ncbi:glycosyltransferase [bacterium]|nr:glycosyltransferase [bacterium]MCI0605099.1 glycosyltransferase [bacterium]
MSLFFSVIIPTHNRPEELASCLRCLAELNYARDHFEVIVVDDGSDVPPEDVVQSFANQLDITLITQPNAGPAAARNAAAAKAKGEYLAFTDDDCRPTPEWLSAFSTVLLNSPDCAVGGRTINALPENLFSAASQSIIDFVYSRLNTNSGHARFFTSNNMALPAHLFKSINGFDPRMRTSEDRDFSNRWFHQGYGMIFVPAAIIYHAHVLNFYTFWRQHLHYGCGAFHWRKNVANRDRKRIALESRRYYLELLGHPLSHNRNWRGLSLSFLLLVSQIATTIGFLSEWIRSGSEAHNP